MDNIKIIVFEIGKKPYAKEIPNELQSMQSIVGGRIETVNITKSVCIVMNEEGKINRMLPNRLIISSNFKDMIFGNCFIVGSDICKAEFVSLTKAHVEEVERTVKII